MKKMIKKFIQYIKESTYIDYFGILYENAPKKLRKLIDSTKHVNQNPLWHPENDVYTHTRLVTNRLANAYPNDKNLLLAGLFHDLGKLETTKWDENKQSWTAHGHEDVSSTIVDYYASWIENMGANVKIVKEIVDNHMRIKYLGEMNIQNKMEMVSSPNFYAVMKFNSADYGGVGLECKPLIDITNVRTEIQNYLKIQEENKLINSKFNGNLIMKDRPFLKGKELGDKITQFKEHISNVLNIDFREFALKNSKEEIFKLFNKFMDEQDQGGIVS